MLGVLYPERLRHAEDTLVELQSAEDLQWWLDHAHGASPPGLSVKRRGSVADLADQLRILPLELEGVDRVQAAAETVGYALEEAAKPLAQHQRLARRIADIIASTDQEKNRAAALAHRVSGTFQCVGIPGPSLCRQRQRADGRGSAAEGHSRFARRLACYLQRHRLRAGL